MDEFKVILEKFQILEKMYQYMRIVDPVRKKVLEYKNGKLHEVQGNSCFEYWGKQVVCENCISIRAYNNDDTYYKIECKDRGICMVTAVPVSINGEKVVLELLNDATNSLYYSDGKLRDEATVISSIEHMSKAATNDSLTNLYNRRYINERLPSDILTSSINNVPLSIIFADLDFFKTINDNYGHSFGDLVLREFADELNKHIRYGIDWAARYGGEEFLICLPSTDNHEAKAVAERIRKSVMQKEFIVKDKIIHITCSFGVYTVSYDTENLTIDNLIEQVDKKLYEAKNSGRNKVI